MCNGRHFASRASKETSMSAANPTYPATNVVVYTQTAWSRFWSWVGWLGFFIAVIIVFWQWARLYQYFDTGSGIEEKYVSGPKMVDDKIAIITVSGVIMDGEGFVKHQ